MTIEPGEKLFQFASKQDWINKAQRIWRFHGVQAESTVCVDQQGRICTIGLHFMAAERDNAYPIEVFMQRPDMLPPNVGAKRAATAQPLSVRLSDQFGLTEKE